MNKHSHRDKNQHRHHPLFYYIITIVVCLTTSTGYAIELKEAQRIARLYSDQAQVISAERQIDNASAAQTVSFTKPQLNGYAAWVKIDSDANNPWETTPRRAISAELQASQLLFAGGSIWHSWALNDSLQQLAVLKNHSHIRQLEYNVAMAFLAVQQQQQIYQIAEDRVQQRQQELEDATVLFDLGMVAQLDKREALLALQQAQNDLQATDSQLFVTITNFNQLLGRSASEKQLIPSTTLAQLSDTDSLLKTLADQIANSSQLDIVTSQLDTTISNQQQHIASSEYWPTVAATASGGTSGDHHTERDDTWTVGLQLDWNLINGGATRAKTAQAQARAMQSRARQQQIYKQLTGYCAKLQQQHHDLLAQLKRQRQTVELAQENYADARALYAAGSITITRLGQYNLAFAESRFNLTQLLYAHNRLYHEIRRLIEERVNL